MHDHEIDRVNRLFLLALAPLGVGCPGGGGGEGGSGESTGTGGSSTTASTISAGPTTQADTSSGNGTADGTTGTGTASTTSMVDSTTGPADSTTGPADSTTGPASSSSSSDGGSSSSSSDGGSSSSSSDGGSSSTGMAQTLCEGYAALIAYCYGPMYEAVALMYCNDYQAYLVPYGPACLAAFDDFLVCLNNLTCMELMNPAACEPEFIMFEATCFP